MSIDAIFSGSGILGRTVARRLVEVGRKVLVLENRPVVGDGGGGEGLVWIVWWD